MKMRKVLLGLSLLLILVILCACGGAKGMLLSQESANVTGATIYYDDGTSTTLSKDDQELKDLSKTLGKTATAEKTIDLAKDAALFETNKYKIDLDYADDKEEHLFADAEGAYFFRYVNNDQGYIGGENQKIATMLDQVKGKKRKNN